MSAAASTSERARRLCIGYPALQNIAALRQRCATETRGYSGPKSDGQALPGGPTERLLNTILAGGLSALRPSAQEAPDRKAFEDRLKLRGTVGRKGDNH